MMQKDEALFEYLLRLGDNSLILGHRLSEWCGHGPVLEQDIALTNIALDLVGQATLFLEYAAKIEDKGRSADDLAFLRDAMHFRNAMLVEQPNGDFAFTLVRQFLFDAHQYHFFNELQRSKDEHLAAIATKSLKEITYHLRHSAEWVVRLGDGTAESHRRMQDAIDEIWGYTGGLFDMNETDEILIREEIGADQRKLKPLWDKTVKEVFERATLNIPAETYMHSGSLEGRHTEHLGYLLAEMQFLPRAYPGAKW
jgi:ring-1,2-phenylacetyl-CoA epoxidase subunit PaaC